MNSKIIGVIPARIGSEEVHAKVLKDIGGKPVIQHVFERASESELLSEILIAADHAKIIETAESFGATAVLTKKEHKCGSDRCAEAVQNKKADIIVNIQADEPFLNPKMIDEVIQPLLKPSDIDICTLCTEFQDEEAANSIFNVKVVRSLSQRALYFSRSYIPYQRNAGIVPLYHHLGIYAYRYQSLQNYAAFGPSPLELREGLEQLRALENGMKILVLTSVHKHHNIQIDTAEDIEKARAYLETNRSS